MKLIPVNILPLKEKVAEFLNESESTRGSNSLESKRNGVDRNGPHDKFLEELPMELIDDVQLVRLHASPN